VSEIVDHGRTRAGVMQLRRHWPVPDATVAMLLVHGIGEHSGRYARVAAGFNAAGIDVVAIDLVGFGGSGGRRGHVDSFDQHVEDVADQLAQVRTMGLPTVLFGHSMGGLIALLTVLQHREPRPDLLVLSGPALAAGIPALLRKVTPAVARVAPRLPVRSPVARGWLSTDPAVGAAYAADPANVHVTTPALGAALLQAIGWANAHIDQLDVPTLVVHGGDDRLVPTTSSAVLEQRPGVERRVYEGHRHEVHNEPDGDEIVAEVAAWIHARLGGAGAPERAG
jgi:alpha-beta hydrolase superfamily lysophospholipase